MKKFLLLTDLSANAKNAAEYGYDLARQIKASMVLCNIITVPADSLLAATVVWPAYDHNTLMDDSATSLKKLAQHLKARNKNIGFDPPITAVNKDGSLSKTANDIGDTLDADLVIMGTHSNSWLNTFVLGDHTKQMIDETNKPLLLVPGSAEHRPIKKLAYATDFNDPEEDLAALFHLINFAKLMNAEILIVHAYTQTQPVPRVNKPLDRLLVELSNKANYPNIYYRVIQSRSPETGLNWLCGHGQIDMLVMLHRPKNFFEELFKGSYTKEISHYINIPLMVIPESMTHQ